MTLYITAIAVAFLLVIFAVWLCYRSARNTLAMSEALSVLMRRRKKSDGIDEAWERNEFGEEGRQ